LRAEHNKEADNSGMFAIQYFSCFVEYFLRKKIIRKGMFLLCAWEK